MDDREYKEWLKGVPTLTESQLNDVTNRIKILSFATTKEFNGRQDFGVRVSEAICSTFKKLGVDCPNPNTLRRSSAYASAKPKMEDLAKFFESVSSQRIIQDAILLIGLESLYHQLLHWGPTISAHTMLQQIHRLPSCLSKSFPGYAESGILHKVVKV